jgi:hypothetical protein
MPSSFSHPPVVDVFIHSRVIQISGGICANLHIIAVLVGGIVVDSSSELHES